MYFHIPHHRMDEDHIEINSLEDVIHKGDPAYKYKRYEFKYPKVEWRSKVITAPNLASALKQMKRFLTKYNLLVPEVRLDAISGSDDKAVWGWDKRNQQALKFSHRDYDLRPNLTYVGEVYEVRQPITIQWKQFGNI